MTPLKRQAIGGLKPLMGSNKRPGVGRGAPLGPPYPTTQYKRIVAFDGNCMPPATSYSLFGGVGYHKGVRGAACTWVPNHRGDFDGAITAEVTFDEYIQNMRQDGEWGNNSELVAASIIYINSIWSSISPRPWKLTPSMSTQKVPQQSF